MFARGYRRLQRVPQNFRMARAGLPPLVGVESALRDAVDARLRDLELDYKTAAARIGVSPNTLRGLGVGRISPATRQKLTGLHFNLAQIDELLAADLRRTGGRRPTVATIAVLCDSFEPWQQDLVLDLVKALSRRSIHVSM